MRNRRRTRAPPEDSGNARWLRGKNAGGFVLRRAIDARASGRAPPIALRLRRSAPREFLQGQRRAIRGPACRRKTATESESVAIASESFLRDFPVASWP